MTLLIKPEDEASVRLVVFGAALLAIATRTRVYFGELPDVLYDAWGNPTDSTMAKENARAHINEARAIADAVIAEAKRLQELKP